MSGRWGGRASDKSGGRDGGPGSGTREKTAAAPVPKLDVLENKYMNALSSYRALKVKAEYDRSIAPKLIRAEQQMNAAKSAFEAEKAKR
jgi:hypothetical protein